MNNWNYKSTEKVSNGYEDVLPVLKTYTKEKFLNASEFERSKMIEEVFNIYRSKNIFPIMYFNEEGVKAEVKKCINKKVEWDGKVLDIKANQGSALCKFIFPNLHRVECKGAKNNSMHDRFYDDHKLKRAIELALKIKNGVTPSEVRTALELIGGNVATNFKIINAKALIEKYTPEDGIVYDFAAGFGGRMLGTLSSDKNYKYLAVEPCTETYEGLLNLGQAIESVTGRTNSYHITKCGSEDKFTNRRDWVDFAFSSPPYFTLERYSDEESQCYIKYPTLEEWFEGYVKPTIQNIYDMLKPGSHYAVNIADFKVGSKEVKYVNEWIKMSLDIGFEYIENIPMKLTVRKGVGHDKEEKQEGIFVFKKTIRE